MRQTRAARGFSMLELLIVVAIVLIVSAMAVPVVMNSVRQMRVRATASEVAGILQTARMRAVRDNTYYHTLSTLVVEGGARRVQVWVDLDDDGAYDAATATTEGEPVTLLPSSIFFRADGNPSTDTMKLAYDAEAPTVTPRFNARGLPCTMNGSICETGSPPVGFQYYMSGPGLFGGEIWAAVSVSPAGRIKTWTWTGTAWVD